MKTKETKKLTKIAILGAIAAVLMMFDFPLPGLFPPFYKLDFSEVAVLIGGFALGPGAACAIEALKIGLNLLFKPTSTAYVGEVANFLIGISFAIPAAMIYQKKKSKENAKHGLIVGSIVMAVIGFVMNYFVLLPAYSYFYHLPLDVIIGMGAEIVPFINNKFMFVLCATTPFNIVKAVIVSILTYKLYKHVSPLLKR